MSNQEASFSFTTKVGGDLLTVRGDDFDSFLANLAPLSLVPAVTHLIEVIEGKAVASAVEAFGGAVVSTPASPQFAPVAPPATATAVGSKTCKHGVMLQRIGHSAKGEWRAFFCPTPKDTPDQCQAVFAKRGTPEWEAF